VGARQRRAQFRLSPPAPRRNRCAWIGSYTQLLERRYGDRLDPDGRRREFMGFIVDGCDADEAA